MLSRTVQPRILIVDDNVDAAEVMKCLLDIQGYDTRAVFNARDALKISSDFKPHIIVSDLLMPEIGGIEFAQLIRQAPYCTDAYLIAVSGWSGVNSKAEVYDAGFDAMYSKPLEFDPFLSGIATVLKQRHPLSALV